MAPWLGEAAGRFVNQVYSVMQCIMLYYVVCFSMHTYPYYSSPLNMTRATVSPSFSIAFKMSSILQVCSPCIQEVGMGGVTSETETADWPNCSLLWVPHRSMLPQGRIHGDEGVIQRHTKQIWNATTGNQCHVTSHVTSVM